MSQRKRRSPTKKGGQPIPEEGSPPVDDHRPALTPNPPQPNKWFLATTILLQATWITFLFVLALQG